MALDRRKVREKEEAAVMAKNEQLQGESAADDFPMICATPPTSIRTAMQTLFDQQL